MEPIVKWAGGKRKLAPKIVELLKIGECTDRYVEPFLGGAAVFLHLVDEFPTNLFPMQYLLNDALKPLIDAYYAIVVDTESVISELSAIRTSYELPLEEFIDAEMQAEYRNELYYQVRRCFNSGGVNHDCHMPGTVAMRAHLAADFIFLNKSCFNGLWRISRKTGEMNVPHGKPKKLSLPSADQLREFAQLVPRQSLRCTDATGLLADCGDGDAIYADPPYDTSDDNVAEPAGSFTTYAGSFNWEDQVKLADALRGAAHRGARVVASNRATDRVIKLYDDRGFTVEHVGVRHSVGAKGDRRGIVGEILAHRGPG